MKKTLIEFIKFSSTGVLNTGIHIGMLYILTEYAGFYYILASFIGFILSVTNSFIINTAWTFKRKIRENTSRRYAKFFTISSIAAGVNILILYLITELFGVWYIISQLFATIVSLSINFIGNKKWTYNV